METESFTKISKTFADNVDKLYKTGGLALVFVFIGLLLTIFSFIYTASKYSLPMFVIGSLLTLTSFILFSITQYMGPIKARKTLKESMETMDTLQELSIDLVNLTSNIQSYCFKNLNYIQATVNTALPLVKPFLGVKGQEIAIKIKNVSAGIVDIISKSEKVIRDIKKALKKNDFKVLKQYESDITDLNKQIKKALSN